MFTCDSLYADVSNQDVSNQDLKCGIKSKIQHLRIPGSGITELSHAVVYRIRSMHVKVGIPLISAGTNDQRENPEDFYRKAKKLLEFCIEQNVLFLICPIPYSKYISESKTDEFNCLIDELSFF